MKRIQVHTKIIIATLFLIGFQTFLVYGDSNQETSNTTEVKVETNDNEAKTEEKAKPSIEKKAEEVKPILKPKPKVEKKINSNKIPIATTIFVNGRVNPITLIIIDHKNKHFTINLAAGKHFNYQNKHLPDHLQKVTCSDIHSPTVTLSKADLDTYAVFLFNENQKTEKFHFINGHQEAIALKYARDTRNKALFDEISAQTVYNP